MLRMLSQCTRSGKQLFLSVMLSPLTIAVRRVLLSPPHAKKTELFGSAFSLCGAVTRHLTCEACCACCGMHAIGYLSLLRGFQSTISAFCKTTEGERLSERTRTGLFALRKTICPSFHSKSSKAPPTAKECTLPLGMTLSSAGSMVSVPLSQVTSVALMAAGKPRLPSN